MNTQQQQSASHACGEQVASKPSTPHQQIKLALDVHAATIVVVRMIDGARPQPPQTMSPAGFLQWIQQQQSQAQEVVSCNPAILV